MYHKHTRLHPGIFLFCARARTREAHLLALHWLRRIAAVDFSVSSAFLIIASHKYRAISEFAPASIYDARPMRLDFIERRFLSGWNLFAGLPFSFRIGLDCVPSLAYMFARARARVCATDATGLLDDNRRHMAASLRTARFFSLLMRRSRITRQNMARSSVHHRRKHVLTRTVGDAN